MVHLKRIYFIAFVLLNFFPLFALNDNFFLVAQNLSSNETTNYQGQSYSNLLIGEKATSKHFIHLLYDPIRPYAVHTCGIKEACPDAWIEASGIRSCYEYDKHAYGFKNRGYNITIGIQAPLYNDILLGTALFYEEDYYTFNLEGRGHEYSLLGGFYALYRPKDFYIFADLFGGVSFGKISRTSIINLASYQNDGRPQAQTYDLYIESGFDLFNNCFIIQPFVGINAEYNNWQALRENGGNIASINIKRTKYFELSSRLGLHLYTDASPSLITFGLDANWAYRLTKFNGYRYMVFQQSGSSHILESVNLAPNSLEFCLYLSKEVNNSLMLYIEGSSELWRNASEGSLSLGILYKW
jgi:uncharacterized protein with beta-barrel porin domain